MHQRDADEPKGDGQWGLWKAEVRENLVNQKVKIRKVVKDSRNALDITGCN